MSEAAPHESHTSDEIVDATVRRAPKYGVFLVLGGIVGVIVAAILTFVFDGTSEPSVAGVEYSQLQVFGFLSLVCISIGLVVFGTLALVLDRTIGRRVQRVRVDHARIHTVD